MVSLRGLVATLATATLTLANEVFDVIIIGSGPGGLVAAEYLTRDNKVSVLVLEAGVASLQETGGQEVPDYIRPDSWTVFDIPGEYTSLAFPSDNNGRYRIDWVASPGPLYLGKVVGGSSSLNGMLYFHTADSYVKETKWPYDTATVNSNYAEIQKSFGQTNRPSTDDKWYLQEAYNIAKDAFLGQGFREVDINAERNDKSKSFGHPPFAIKDGLRDSPAKTFYGAAKKRSNFKLVTSAMASHIVQVGGKATGVVYSNNGQSITASLSARGSVILAAGAVSTPKVLIQSGIGPRDQLDLLAGNPKFPGIGTDSSKWVINENVGKNMFDTIQVLTTFKHPTMKTFLHGSHPTDAINQYAKNQRSGPWASPDPILIGYDYYNGNQFQVTGFCHGFNFEGNNQDKTEFGLSLYLNNPKSRTRCEFLKDGSYHFNKHGFLYNNTDDTAAMDSFFKKIQFAFEQAGSTFVQRRGMEGSNHYGGSCVPSNDVSDAQRCADGVFKVLGTSNVFVGDASLMREGTVNPYGFTMQIGRQAGLNVEKFLSNGPAPSTCTPIEENTDYFGNDIGTSVRETAEECCNDCAAHPNCKLFVWFEGTCWLKSAPGSKSTLPGRRAGSLQTKTPTPTPSPTPTPFTCSKIEENTDYDGSDIASTRQPTAEQCCNDCKANVDCKLFVWFDGTCYLKSTTGAKLSLPGRRAAFVDSKPPSSCSRIENDVDYFGNDISSTRRATAELCCDDCKATLGCQLFVWFDGTCWLKNVKGQKSTMLGARAGFVDGASTSCGPVESNIDYIGEDIREVPASSTGACCQSCQQEAGCNAYTWSKAGVCYMKRGRSGTTPNDSAMSARVNKCTSIENGIDYNGNDIASVPSAVIDDCCAHCRNTNGCKAFSYAYGTCYLKSAKGQVSSNPNVQSATVLV